MSVENRTGNVSVEGQDISVFTCSNGRSIMSGSVVRLIVNKQNSVVGYIFRRDLKAVIRHPFDAPDRHAGTFLQEIENTSGVDLLIFVAQAKIQGLIFIFRSVCPEGCVLPSVMKESSQIAHTGGERIESV